MNLLLRLAAIPYYLALFFAFLIWITVLCPLAFMTDCSVTNKTGESLSVTPIGTVGPDGQRTLLPLYRTSFPYFVKSKRGDFQVRPGETFRFDYDMDDVNFSEIVVENPAGEMRQIIVNLNPTQNQYMVPDETNFVVGDFASLVPTTPNVKAVAIEAHQSGRMWLIYIFSAILLIVEMVRMRRAKRKPAPKIAT
ncbi:hypothetical protein N9Y42_06310 [Mariniblastus sp.]|nr:hypothetical protein [Mariniblastus sp.]